MKKQEIIKRLEAGMKPKQIAQEVDAYYSYVLAIKKEWKRDKELAELKIKAQ